MRPTPLDGLLDTLDLEQIDRDIFRGKSPPTTLQRVFGGQVAGQALVAAQRSVGDAPLHSLHAYFLRPGQVERPIIYEVDRIRDGRSYSTRRVAATQGGKPIFHLQASFQHHEDGYEHQLAMPGCVLDPDQLPAWRSLGGDDATRPSPALPFDLRQAPACGGYDRLLWLRTNGRLPDDPNLHRCVAAYASDLTLISTALLHHPAEPDPSFMASLDHAMWFHRPFRVDEWLLYAQLSPSATGGRALAQGHLFAADGRLAVSVVQEGAIRPPRSAPVPDSAAEV